MFFRIAFFSKSTLNFLNNKESVKKHTNETVTHSNGSQGISISNNGKGEN